MPCKKIANSSGGKYFFVARKKLFFLLENSLFPVGLFLSLIMRELQKLAQKVKYLYSFILPCCSETRTKNFCKRRNCIFARTYNNI
jgi:hypothetical protein